MGVGGSLPPLGSAGVSEKGFWDVEIHLVEVGVEILCLWDVNLYLPRVFFFLPLVEEMEM